jgi:hypothetical protein
MYCSTTPLRHALPEWFWARVKERVSVCWKENVGERVVAVAEEVAGKLGYEEESRPHACRTLDVVSTPAVVVVVVLGALTANRYAGEGDIASGEAVGDVGELLK